jgi:uncharacterized protein YqcC (DUF446 family)
MGSRCTSRLDHCTYIEARNNGTLAQVVSIKCTTDGSNVRPLALQGRCLQNSHLWHPVSSAPKELQLTSTWPEPVETLLIINWSQSIFGERALLILTSISNHHSTQHVNRQTKVFRQRRKISCIKSTVFWHVTPCRRSRQRVPPKRHHSTRRRVLENSTFNFHSPLTSNFVTS